MGRLYGFAKNIQLYLGKGINLFRQLNYECSPLAGFALRFNCPAMRLDKLPCNRQTEPAMRICFACARTIPAPESVEDKGQILFWKPRTAILYCHACLIYSCFCREGNCPAFGRVMKCVRDQV